MENTNRIQVAVQLRKRKMAFFGLSIGNFLVLLDTSILNVALPHIQRDFNAAAELLPWTSVAYTIIFSGLLLASGAVADRVGGLRLYRISLVAFSIISLACAASPSIQALIGFRALLGVAAASVVPASIAVLAGLYPDSGERARAIGSWAAISSIGLLAGPVLGGFFADQGSWRMIFVVNIPVAVTALLFVRTLSNTRSKVARPLDVPGIILSIILLTSMSYGFIDGGTNGLNRPTVLIALGIAFSSAIILVKVERMVAHPVLPPTIFAQADLRFAVISAAVATLVFYGILFTLAIWYQKAGGLSATETGLAFIPMTLPLCVLPFFTGRMVARFGAERLILFGLVCDVLAGLFLVGATGASGSFIWVVLAEVALVLASTTVIPAATALVAIRAPAEYAGSTQGALNAGRQAGAALGVAILGPLASLSTVGWVLSGISLFVTVVVIQGRASAHQELQ